MPLISPTEFVEFTSIQALKTRSSTLLSYDILEAETEIFNLCGHDFSDSTLYPSIPEAVKLADLKLTQYYALKNSDESVIKGVRSQNLGDFSFTADGPEKPSVSLLLRPYMNYESGQGNVSFRMGAL
jgi:hypothetical protein